MNSNNMTPFFAVIDHDIDDIYINLYADRDNALAYADTDQDDIDSIDDLSIDDVYSTASCNDYLKAHNGYIAEIFEGHALY